MSTFTKLFRRTLFAFFIYLAVHVMPKQMNKHETALMQAISAWASKPRKVKL